MDGHTALSITAAMGVEGFLDRLRAALKDRSFRPLPVRERMIPQGRRQETPPGNRDGEFILPLLQLYVGMFRVGGGQAVPDLLA